MGPSSGSSKMRGEVWCKLQGSSRKSRIKNGSTGRGRAPHNATQIRNAYVPVPPAKPVVSVSRKSHFDGSAIAARVRLQSASSRFRESSSRLTSENSANSGDENQLRTKTCCPYWFVAIPAPSRRDKESSACGPRSSSAPDGLSRAGFQAAILENLSVSSAITPTTDRVWPEH